MVLRQLLRYDPVSASYLFGCGGKASGALVLPVTDAATALTSSVWRRTRSTGWSARSPRCRRKRRRCSTFLTSAVATIGQTVRS
jgi:hypothetical protein